jgi:hypothetical protein
MPNHMTASVEALTTHASALELTGEYVAMARFVLLKFLQSMEQAGIAPTTGKALAAVDVDGSVFASVIYLKNSVTKSLS